MVPPFMLGELIEVPALIVPVKEPCVALIFPFESTIKRLFILIEVPEIDPPFMLGL